MADAREPGITWPPGLLERVKAAEQRIHDNHAPRRIPADPHGDVDLVLAEVRYLIEGNWPPFWIKDASGVAPCQHCGQIGSHYDDCPDACGVRAQFPDCGACPGDGTICPKTCRLAEESPPAPAGVKRAATYKLLGRGDKIERGDEVLADDTVNWLPLVGWEVGMEWGSNLMPVRRRTDGVTPHHPTPLGQVLIAAKVLLMEFDRLRKAHADEMLEPVAEDPPVFAALRAAIDGVAPARPTQENKP